MRGHPSTSTTSGSRSITTSSTETPNSGAGAAPRHGKGRMTAGTIGSGIVAGAIALGSVALAQSVPPQFVVSGKAAEQIQDFTTINLATAQGIAEACQKLAAEQNVA